jgi:hypothetical protein
MNRHVELLFIQTKPSTSFTRLPLLVQFGNGSHDFHIAKRPDWPPSEKNKNIWFSIKLRQPYCRLEFLYPIASLDSNPMTAAARGISALV